MTRPLHSKYSVSKQTDDDHLVRYHLDKGAMDYLYRQMAGHIAGRIAAGELVVNQVLPAEVRLAREYGVSLGTARHATKLLRDWGLVTIVRCKGTFVVGMASKEDAQRIAAAYGAGGAWEHDQ